MAESTVFDVVGEVVVVAVDGMIEWRTGRSKGTSSVEQSDFRDEERRPWRRRDLKGPDKSAPCRLPYHPRQPPYYVC